MFEQAPDPALEQRISTRDKVIVKGHEDLLILYDNDQAFHHKIDPATGESWRSVSLNLRTGEWGYGLNYEKAKTLGKTPQDRGFTIGTMGSLVSYDPIDNAHIGFDRDSAQGLDDLLRTLRGAGVTVPKRPQGYPELAPLIKELESYGTVIGRERLRDLVGRTIGSYIMPFLGLDPDWYFKPGREFKRFFTGGREKYYSFRPEHLKAGGTRITDVSEAYMEPVALVDYAQSRIDIFSPKAYFELLRQSELTPAEIAQLPEDAQRGYYYENGNSYDIGVIDGTTHRVRDEHPAQGCDSRHFFDRTKNHVFTIYQGKPDYMELATLMHVHFLNDHHRDFLGPEAGGGVLRKNDTRLILPVAPETYDALEKLVGFPYHARDLQKLWQKTPTGVTQYEALDLGNRRTQ